MMEWVLHIGTQKTGSKALQHVLSDELHRVRGAKLYYPRYGREGIWHEPLHYALEAGETDRLTLARNEARATGADIAVLSCEGFHELPLKAIQLLHDTIGDATVVLFLRQQDSLLNSWYNQLIKAHRVSFDEIRTFERQLTKYDVTWDYWATLERWAEIFGWERQRPIIYDKSSCTANRFLAELGLTLDREGLSLDNPNKALSAQGCALIRGVKELIGGSPEPQLIESLHEQLANDFVDTFGTEEIFLFDLATRESILSIYHDSNERVRQRFFPERSGLFDAATPGRFQPLDIDEGTRSARGFLSRRQ